MCSAIISRASALAATACAGRRVSERAPDDWVTADLAAKSMPDPERASNKNGTPAGRPFSCEGEGVETSVIDAYCPSLGQRESMV
jgi:hypothetical protein